MSTERIGVVGTGTMGSGIAQVAAQAGFEVLYHNRTRESLERGLGRVRQSLDRLVRREKLTGAQRDEALERIQGVVSLSDLKNCDVVIESAPEELEIKRAIFEALDEILAEDAIIATNTSSLSITRLSTFVSRPGHFVGMHFFNPVPAMKLVEVVRGLNTSEATAEAVRDLAERFGKIPIDVRDSPGFVVNRVVMPMINEAAFALMEGVADARGIDECMKLGCNHPMGPLALADLVGLDVVLAILETLHRDFGDPRYRPCPEIRKRVEAGWLGKKTGRGFYTYEK